MGVSRSVEIVHAVEKTPMRVKFIMNEHRDIRPGHILSEMSHRLSGGYCHVHGSPCPADTMPVDFATLGPPCRPYSRQARKSMEKASKRTRLWNNFSWCSLQLAPTSVEIKRRQQRPITIHRSTGGVRLKQAHRHFKRRNTTSGGLARYDISVVLAQQTRHQPAHFQDSTSIRSPAQLHK